MRFAINVPNFGTYSDARVAAELAREAEDAGWDGFFVWDHILGAREWQVPIADPWVLLAAVAMQTERIRIGPMVTPLPRRRPWKLARETVTLDHLSGGRLILGVGLGFPPDAEFEQFGEESDARVRAGKLDEGLAVLVGLWSGEPFRFEGRHYQVAETVFLPRPVQQPRIPVWVGAVCPNRPPLRRAARWDGVFPIRMAGQDEMPPPVTPADVQNMLAFIETERAAKSGDRAAAARNRPASVAAHPTATTTGSAPAPPPVFDVVVGGETGADPARDAEDLAAHAEAGTTWWAEHVNEWRGSLDDMRRHVRRGPPRV